VDDIASRCDGVYRPVLGKAESDHAISVTVPGRAVRPLKSGSGVPSLFSMHIIRLVYASTAASTLAYDDLVGLLRHASHHNDEADITGLLVYSHGLFLQVLEGERGGVNRLYNRIVADARHADCMLLLAEGIETRAFADWSMKLVGLDDLPTARRRELLLRHAGRRRFNPYGMTSGQALGFLQELAESERLVAPHAA